MLAFELLNSCSRLNLPLYVLLEHGSNLIVIVSLTQQVTHLSQC